MSSEGTQEQVTSPIAHRNVALLRAQSAEDMDTVMGSDRVRGLIWKRLDETTAVVDPTMVRTLLRRLDEMGVRAAVRSPHQGSTR